MAGTLVLFPVDQPPVGYRIFIVTKYLDGQGVYQFVNMPIIFVAQRLRPGQCTIGATIAATTANFITAFNLDYRNYGGTNNFTASNGLNGAIDIQMFNENWLFDSVTDPLGIYGTNVENTTVEIKKGATFQGYDYPNSNCGTVRAIYEAAGGVPPYNTYVDNVPISSNVLNPLSLDLIRAGVYSIRITDSEGTLIHAEALKTPEKIKASNLNISISYTDNGGSVAVNTEYVSEYLLPLNFSLDGVNYSETNVFTGQPEGDYTVYVKDAFGCIATKNFTVDGVSEITETFFELSDINPIRYAIVENGKKNRYNTLSHEQKKALPYPFVQNFTVANKPITQIKTNARYLNIFALDCDGSKTPLTPIKRTNHLGQELKTTATQFSTEEGKAALYFGPVDILDPLTDAVLESKNYGYQIPNAFDMIGRFITVDGLGTIPVKGIVYDEGYEAFVIQTDVNYTAAIADTTVQAIYNVQNYEVYEFVADISVLPESFNVVIEAGYSAQEIDYTFISEKIERVADSDDLDEIIYWNTTNHGGMNYATGVVHTLRLHTVLSRLSDEQTVKGYNGDIERYNTNHEIFDGEEFIFGYLSEEMVRKVRLILTHDRLFINGILYRLGDAPELNSRYSTNTCELTAVLRKGGDITEDLETEIIEPVTGEGVDQATYELNNAIAAAKGKALILWKS